MKNLKSPIVNLKSFALVVVVVGLILLSGFIATKTLLFTGTWIESSGRSNLNANTSYPGGRASSGDSNVSSGDSSVTSEPSVTLSNPSVVNPSGMVWVNTKTGVYHCPNSRWYGNTKNGKHMTQSEAESKGYRPAYGLACR